MVNKEAKVAVYFFDDGFRGRQVSQRLDKLLADGIGMKGNLMQKGTKFHKQFLGSARPVSERRTMLYRPLELRSLATERTQELAKKSFSSLDVNIDSLQKYGD